MTYDAELNIAVQQLNNRLFADAKSSLENLIKKYPDKINSYYYLGKIESAVYNNLDKSIELLSIAVEIAPCYEVYKDLTELYLLQKDLPKTLKCLKQTLIYNSKCEQSLKILKQVFPSEYFFVKDTDTVISGEYEKSSNYKQLKYHKIYESGLIERKGPKFIENSLTENQKKY